MDKRKPQGQYRTEPDGDHAPMVYVWGSGTPSYVTEATYRAKGYLPVFEKLPTEDEYDVRGPRGEKRPADALANVARPICYA